MVSRFATLKASKWPTQLSTVSVLLARQRHLAHGVDVWVHGVLAEVIQVVIEVVEGGKEALLEHRHKLSLQLLPVAPGEADVLLWVSPPPEQTGAHAKGCCACLMRLSAHASSAQISFNAITHVLGAASLSSSP